MNGIHYNSIGTIMQSSSIFCFSISFFYGTILGSVHAWKGFDSMPTTYTHYAFGQDVFHLLSDKTQRSLLPYMDMYNIGLHGPDALFYYRSYRKNKINQYGVKVHDEPCAAFLRRARKVYSSQKDKGLARAYLAGFMTHFILDSTCHPYIRRRISDTGISHTEIETDLDMVIMKKNGLSPASYKPACHMRPRRKYARVMAPYYRRTPRQIYEGIHEMKLVLNHIFRSHFGLKRWLFAIVGERFYPDLNLQYYFVKPHMNPGNKETCRHLLDLYRSCQEECAQMIEGLLDALDKGQDTYFDAPRLKKVFS